MVSVVVATHNRAAIIKETALSILRQPLRDIELIIVNDASQDDTVAVLEQVQRSDDRVKLIHLATNHGPGGTRNAGIAAARYPLVAIMDDDDVLMPQRFVLQRDLLTQHPEIDLAFSIINWIDANGTVMGSFPGIVERGAFPADPDDIFQLLYLESNKVPNTSIMFRRRVFEQFGGYATETWVGEDWFWLMKMAASGVKMRPVAQPLMSAMRDSGHNSLLADKAKAFQAQRKVLGLMRTWLAEQQISRFDHLHNLAWSNQLVREARFWSSVRGLQLCGQALRYAPRNLFAWQTAGEILQRGVGRVQRRLVGRS